MHSRNITILHLSDLHIEDATSCSSGVISDGLDNLIADIVKQTENIKELILVITGDITTKNQFVKNNSAILSFFEKLKKELKPTILDLNIVPGNHDFNREDLKSHKEAMDNASTSRNFSYIPLAGFQNYKDIIIEINQIFEISRCNSTYGVSMCEIEDGCIVFTKINSAWSADSDCKRKLEIGQSQLAHLTQEYKKAKVKCGKNLKKICLSIALSHHPLSWLDVTEEEKLVDAMLDSDFLNSNIFMCGHTHECKILNYNTHSNSVMTLVTGVGGEKQTASDINTERKYSIYNINVPHNSCSIIMRKTINNKDYDDDYSIYPPNYDRANKKTVYPLRSNNSTTFIHANSYLPIHGESFHVSKDFLDTIVKMFPFMSKMHIIAGHVLHNTKNMFYSYLNDSMVTASPIFNEISQSVQDQIFEDKKKFLKITHTFLFYDGTVPISQNVWRSLCYAIALKSDLFSVFLLHFCQAFTTNIKDFFPEKNIVRAHFRGYYGEAYKENLAVDQYVSICSASRISNVDEIPYTPAPKMLPYGGLIEHSYKQDTGLIFSSNACIDTAYHTEWNDFITIIPKNDTVDFMIEIRNEKNAIVEKRPFLTFGLSFKTEDSVIESTRLLAILAYLKIDKFISEVIGQYLQFFPLDKDEFMKTIIKTKYENEKK